MQYLRELSPNAVKSVVVVNPMEFDEEDSSQDANEPLLEQLDKVGITRANEEEIGVAILRADTTQLLPLAKNVRLPSPSVLKPIAPTSHKAVNPNTAIRMDISSPTTPKLQQQQQNKKQSPETSPTRSNQPSSSKVGDDNHTLFLINQCGSSKSSQTSFPHHRESVPHVYHKEESSCSKAKSELGKNVGFLHYD